MTELSMSGKAINADAVSTDSVTPATSLLSFGKKEIANSVYLLPLILISLYVMFAPVWAPRITSRDYDDARYLQIALLALSVVFLFIPQIRKDVLSSWNDLGKKVQTLLVVFVVGGTVSGAYSYAPNLAALELSLLIQLVFVALLICALIRRYGATAEKSLAVAVCAGAALVCVQFWLVQAISIFEGLRFSWVHPFLEFANVRFFSQYQSYVLFLLPVPMLVLALSWKWKAILFLTAANFWALQWMVGTRAVWIAFAAAMIAVCVVSRHGRVAFVRTHLILILAGGAMFAGFQSLMSSTDGATEIPQKLSVVKRGSGSVNERLMLARIALGTIEYKPLTGIGPGQFGLMTYPLRGAHPHNAALQLLSEYGVVAGSAGVLLGLALVVFALRSMRTAGPSRSDVVTVSIAAALVTGLVESLFSGGIIMPHSQMMLCFVAGWLLGRRLANSVPEPGARRLLPMPTALTMAVVASAFITVLIGLEYWSVVRDMPISAQPWHPHFWQYGRFSSW